MTFYVQQSIHIHLLKVGSISNSSVLQIGSSGIIKPSSHLYNTGGFTEPAPKINKTVDGKQPTNTLSTPFVPLAPPTRLHQ